MINTTNFYDGLDGMLNINTLFVCLAVLVVSYYEHHFFISTIIAVALLPIIVILLPFNFPIARIFMGDAGSIVIGYSMSIILIDLLINKLYWIAFVIFFVPSVDVAFTLIKKIYYKINPWERIFDYIFLTPIIKFKKKHVVVTLPFLAYNLISLFLIIVSYEAKISELLIINIGIGISFLIYCFNCKFFFK
jgi:UDP-N-acetylmuramyl pentapeptide phosphotransferase/UDP-N-acetylglucosamine-1-phosphate transferase